MKRKRKDILYLVLLWSLLGFPICGVAQIGEGGGVYIENGGRLISSVVVGNKAGEGFGVAGGDAQLVNCTVIGNESEEGIRDSLFPGFIFCKTGEVMDTETYEVRGIKDAMGVVFWVNSNPFAAMPKMYVLALQEETKAFGTEVESYVDFIDRATTMPGTDTVCYGKMDWLLNKPGTWPAATYCRDYAVAGQPDKVRWTFPAGYQMLAVYAYRSLINQTLQFLIDKGETAELLSDAVYWTFSLEGGTDDLYAWAINFKEEEVDGLGTPGTINTSGNETLIGNKYQVRPIFVYGN